MEPKIYVGQPVIYKLTDADRARYGVTDDRCPAVVTCVHSNSCANLRLLLDNDDVPPRHTSVTKGGKPGQWGWCRPFVMGA